MTWPLVTHSGQRAPAKNAAGRAARPPDMPDHPKHCNRHCEQRAQVTRSRTHSHVYIIRMADPKREHSVESDDDEVDVEALPSARTVKFHTLRNSLAVGVCGALFEARRAMSAAPGGRLGRCVLAGLNTMTVGAIFFGTSFTPFSALENLATHYACHSSPICFQPSLLVICMHYLKSVISTHFIPLRGVTGSQAVMGNLRLEDDAFNSFGAGLVTGSILSGSLMSQRAYLL